MHGKNEDLHFYYVPMPNMLRKSGSFGTHWMLQGHIKVENGSQTKTFDGKVVVQALRAAYAGQPSPAGDGAELAGWIESSPEFATWCADFKEGMSGKSSEMPANCKPAQNENRSPDGSKCRDARCR
jgi:hypothetical protein